jgi:phosphatidylethanolamine-binding protein (PEBP) family uncharacterized protein
MLPNRMPVSARLGLLVVVLVATVGVVTAQVKSPPRSHFVLSSPDARLAVRVPEEYTANVFGCTGGNISPALLWSGAPVGTKSFVITLFDPDVPDTGSGWWHWVVYDVPAKVNSLPKGAGAEHSSMLPAGGNRAAPIWAMTLITAPVRIKGSLLTTTSSRFMP